MKNLDTYIPLCNAIVTLMHPLTEIVIHDLKSNTIAYIAGSLSSRQIGDPSFINSAELTSKQYLYEKITLEGKLVKSISVQVQKDLLICINYDISVFHTIKHLAEMFTSTTPLTKQPKALFDTDWKESLHTALYQYLQDRKWDIKTISTKQKKEVVYYLFAQEAFCQKHAALYIAQALQMGRSTIFKYLKEWKTI